MSHSSNQKNCILTASGARGTRTQSARASNLIPDSDSPCPETPGCPKSAQKTPPIKNAKNRSDRVATPEACGTRSQTALANRARTKSDAGFGKALKFYP